MKGDSTWISARSQSRNCSPILRPATHNAINPNILKSPMVKLVKGKTIEAVFKMVPDSKVSAEEKQKIKDALAAI